MRELLNIVEQTVLLCRSGEIGAEHLPAAFAKSAHSAPPPAVEEIDCPKERLSRLLERHNGNRTLMARELGVERTTLWRRMKRLGLDQDKS